jgi:hypothetical protein
MMQCERRAHRDKFHSHDCRSKLRSQPDRRALDDVVFDVLGLTAGEREAVYEAVVTLVRARLEKARSV